MTTTPKDFHTGGFNSPHEWNLYVLNNTAQFFFWDTFLDGMAEKSCETYSTDDFYSYEAPRKDKYANGCFPLSGNQAGINNAYYNGAK